MKKEKRKENESQSYQTMLQEVENIVQTLGSSEIDLDEMLSHVERGYNLIKNMQGRLDSSKIVIENLKSKFDMEQKKEN